MKLPLKHDFTDKVVVITGAGGVDTGKIVRDGDRDSFGVSSPGLRKSI